MGKGASKLDTPGEGADAEACRRLCEALDDKRCKIQGNFDANGETREDTASEYEETVCVLKKQRPFAVAKLNRTLEQAVAACSGDDVQARALRGPKRSDPAVIHRPSTAADAAIAGELLEVVGIWEAPKTPAQGGSAAGTPAGETAAPTGARGGGLSELQAWVALGALEGQPREDLQSTHEFMTNLYNLMSMFPSKEDPKAPREVQEEVDFDKDHTVATAWLRKKGKR